MTVTAIVPNWNGAARLPAFFRTLASQRALSEILMVDNGSTDGSVEYAQCAGAKVISFATNRGFAAAVNAGVEEAASEWVAVLNNDVELESSWLSVLLQAAIDQQAWFATGKLLDAVRRNRIDGTYDLVCRGGTAWRCGSGSEDGPAFNRPAKIQFAPFTAVLVKRELFRLVGPLDTRFESYLEDVDFGFRCSAKGYTGIYVPGAVGYHQGSATLGRWHPETVRRLSRNQILLSKKYCDPRWPSFVAQGLWGIVALRHRAVLPWLRGKWEGLREHIAREGDFRQLLRDSEQEMHRIQRETGADSYWKLYFLLT